MSTVFVAGSRKIGRLNAEIRQRLDNLIAEDFEVLVGDANGADKAVQNYLKTAEYNKVTVYCSGAKCRNNLGSWDVNNVPVPSGLKGRAFYTVKDVEMAGNADYGFMIWDGKSPGTLNNVLELLKRQKKSLVYVSPTKHFLTVSNTSQFNALLAECSQEDYAELASKINIKKQFGELATSAQGALSF